MLKAEPTSTRLLEWSHPSSLDSLQDCLPPPTPFLRRSLRLFQPWLVHIFRFPVNLRPAVAAG